MPAGLVQGQPLAGGQQVPGLPPPVGYQQSPMVVQAQPLAAVVVTPVRMTAVQEGHSGMGLIPKDLPQQRRYISQGTELHYDSMLKVPVPLVR